jgi:hypothetical protein
MYRWRPAGTFLVVLPPATPDRSDEKLGAGVEVTLVSGPRLVGAGENDCLRPCRPLAFVRRVAPTHSWRRASTGSRREARIAGSRPAIIPTAKRTARETATAPVEIWKWILP